jgi:hypothetical protein
MFHEPSNGPFHPNFETSMHFAIGQSSKKQNEKLTL